MANEIRPYRTLRPESEVNAGGATPAAAAAPAATNGFASVAQDVRENTLAARIGRSLQERQDRFSANLAASSQQQAAGYEQRTGRRLVTDNATPTASAALATPAAATVRRLQPTAPVAAAPAAPRAAPRAVPAAGTAFTLQPGDANTFTGTNGRTRAVPGLLNANERQGQTLASGVEEPTAPRGFVARGAQGGVIGNPDEDRRRLEIALTTVGRGSPSTRRALIELYGDEQRQQQGERMAALNAGYEADIEGQRGAALAEQGYQRRLVDVRIANQDAGLERDRLAADSRQVNRTLTGADGSAQLVRNDGSVSTVMGEDGKPLRVATEGSGALTPQSIIEAYTKQQETIAGAVPIGQDPSAALKQLDASPLGQAYARLLGGNGNAAGDGGAAQVPDAAIAYLRANPGTRNQFDARFGQGAAARYLTP